MSGRPIRANSREVTSTTGRALAVTTRPAAQPCASRTARVHLPRVVAGIERRLQGRRLDRRAHCARPSVVRGIGVLPIFAGVIGLLLLVGSLAATLGPRRAVAL